MKKRNLLLTLLLFCATTMLFAQHLEFQDLTAAIKRPKEISNSASTTIIAPYGDNLLCSVLIAKLPVPDGKMVVLDKQLNVVKVIVLPEEYKKYSYTYLCKVGNRYIISIYKGLKDRLLGLLNENLELIKTYQLSHEYVFERAIYKADNYVILNVNGRQLIKVDEELNVLQSGYLDSKFLLYRRDWDKQVLGNGFVVIQKPDYLFLLNPETLKRVCEIELPKLYGDYERVNFTSLLKGDGDFGSIRSFTYNHEVWKDLMWLREDFPGDWVYIATLYSRYGNKLQELRISAKDSPTGCEEQYCDVIWDEHNHQMIVARASQNYTIAKTAKTTNKIVDGAGKLTLYALSPNKTETKPIETLHIDFPVSSVKILQANKQSVIVLLGGQNIMSVVSVDMKSLAYECLLTKQIEGSLVGHVGLHTNDAGYYVTCNHNEVDTKKAGRATFYNCENIVLFISKDMKNVQSYRTLSSTKDHTVSNYIYSDLCRPDMVVIQHEEPAGKDFTNKELQYYTIDNNGNRQIIPTGLIFYRGITKPVQFSPTEYYLLYDYQEKTFKLCKLTFNPS